MQYMYILAYSTHWVMVLVPSVRFYRRLAQKVSFSSTWYRKCPAAVLWPLH